MCPGLVSAYAGLSLLPHFKKAQRREPSLVARATPRGQEEVAAFSLEGGWAQVGEEWGPQDWGQSKLPVAETPPGDWHGIRISDLFCYLITQLLHAQRWASTTNTLFSSPTSHSHQNFVTFSLPSSSLMTHPRHVNLNSLWKQQGVRWIGGVVFCSSWRSVPMSLSLVRLGGAIGRNLERSGPKKWPRIHKTNTGGGGGAGRDGDRHRWFNTASVKAKCCVTGQVTSLPWGLFPHLAVKKDTAHFMQGVCKGSA